jgi:pantetheine-phosphate adenylyltransferase
MDVVERAARLFDELIVSVGLNPSKQPLIPVEPRLEALRASVAHLENVRVDSFQGLLIDYVHQVGARSVVRGLRATSDFEYEFQMAMVNRRLDSSVETVFLMTKWEYSYLSSSIVREVATLGGDYSEMVTEPVADMIRQALRAR